MAHHRFITFDAGAPALSLPDDVTFEKWAECGEYLAHVERKCMWIIGDWWAFGEKRYGKRKALLERLAAEERRVPAYQTARDAAWVAGQYELSRRRDSLSFAHHREVAALPSPDADALLDKAEANQWGHKQLRAEVCRYKNERQNGGSSERGDTCTVADLATLAEAGRRFGTIYADPPWFYGNQSTRAATSDHYGGLTVAELCAMPVAELATDKSHCHLWTTNGFLRDAFDVLEAWGFEYKSTFVWVKPQMGIGNYWRVSHEFMLLGVRGGLTFADRGQMSWLECERGRHSAKPEKVRHIIEKVSPGPFLELFGRSPAPGWTVWGTQIERGLLYQDVKEVA